MLLEDCLTAKFREGALASIRNATSNFEALCNQAQLSN